MPQQNFGQPGQGERRDPEPRHGVSEARGDTFTPSYMNDFNFKPSYMEELEQAEGKFKPSYMGESGQGNHPTKEPTGSQQRYPPSGPGNFPGEGRY